jgi:hypothetical protein
VQVEVDISRNDYWALLVVLFRSRKTSRGGAIRGLFKFAAFWLAATFVSLAYFKLTGPRPRYPLYVVDVLTPFVVFLLLFAFFVYRSRHRMVPSETGTTLGRHTYSLVEDGVHVSSRHTQVSIRWGGVQELLETNSHFFIMVDRGAGFIVPKRSFSDPLQAAAFGEFIRSHVPAAA